MKIHNHVMSVVEVALEHYTLANEYGLKGGDYLFRRYREEMSGAQVHQLTDARARCEAALAHPLRHFTGGLSCFSPF